MGPKRGDQTFVETVQRHVGVPEYNRRLADKILTAFNHAYATGEIDIAQDLHAALEKLEQRQRTEGPSPRSKSLVADAKLWTGFVDARDRYQSISNDPDANDEAVAEALADMKEAFRLWSVG
ncbi:MAG: hypothetical protein WCF16_06855 [Alphaproteobacteria bacterium]